MDAQTRTRWLIIHNAIHNPRAVAVKLGGIKYPVQRTGGGLRFINWGDRKFIEQNPESASRYAVRARQGHKITWAIPHQLGPSWTLIEDGVII